MEKKTWGKLPEIHILVCTNERPPGNPKGSCAEKGSVALFDALKREVEHRGLRGQVLVNRTNCMKPCEFGPTVVVHPLETWYGGAKAEDAGEILDAALRGEAVERLCLPEAAYKAF
ncbi:MAG TPA: (2Fe-2S) ferredoxin domain-containing protein [Stenomitos sp.]